MGTLDTSIQDFIASDKSYFRSSSERVPERRKIYDEHKFDQAIEAAEFELRRFSHEENIASLHC